MTDDGASGGGLTDGDQVLTVEVRGRVAVLTLNRPERRNALNRALRRRLHEAVAEVEADDGVDVTILTGADPAFCAGLDLTEFGTRDSGLSEPALVAEALSSGPLGPHAKPLIGAVNGAAVTGGLEVALHCDFLVASESARFADTHARVGVMPGWGLTVLLAEAVGVRRARQMSVTGDYVDARVALEWGLVNRVVPHADLLPTCLELADSVVSNDQPGVRQVLATYERQRAVLDAGAWAIEGEVHRSWSAARGGDAPSGDRLGAVIDRGRTQLSGA
jgi:enoyl-CoA hydratase